MKPIFCWLLAILIGLGVSSVNYAADQPAATATVTASDTGGSLKGDFGPPQGEPIEAILTSPPNVPPPTGRHSPAKVIVKLDVVEKVMQISEGVDYTFWTFGGTVPGNFIRVRQGDTVELHLSNMPDSKMPHNIDLHGVTGPGGWCGDDAIPSRSTGQLHTGRSLDFPRFQQNHIAQRHPTAIEFC